MMVLITYDVNTADPGGQTRLRKVAKICEDYGQRVQHSVFECVVTPALYIDLKEKLKKTIHHEKDSLRFYMLGKNWKKSLELEGRNNTYNPEEDSFVY